MKVTSIINGLWISGLTLVLTVAPVAAQSLFETYASATSETLSEETQQMGRQLSQSFNQQTIADYQQQIDFAEYLSGLKKAVFYAEKLATYTEYEADLQFARDKEVFKGLPDEGAVTDVSAMEERREFVAGKYQRMTKNVEEEIETYIDMMQISLDACESLAVTDLNGMFERGENQKKIRTFLRSQAFTNYQNKQADFSQRWQELSLRIDAQLALWQPKAASPTDPLIAPHFIEAL